MTKTDEACQHFNPINTRLGLLSPPWTTHQLLFTLKGADQRPSVGTPVPKIIPDKRNSGQTDRWLVVSLVDGPLRACHMEMSPVVALPLKALCCSSWTVGGGGYGGYGEGGGSVHCSGLPELCRGRPPLPYTHSLSPSPSVLKAWCVQAWGGCSMQGLITKRSRWTVRTERNATCLTGLAGWQVTSSVTEWKRIYSMTLNKNSRFFFFFFNVSGYEGIWLFFLK